MLSKEDILTEFKSKINEAVSMVSKIPAEKRAEVWNFWELVTITVKLITQVYVEDTTAKPKQNIVKHTFNKKEDVSQQYPKILKDEILDKRQVISNNEVYSNVILDCSHLDSESVRNEVQTLDFTDLISCPGSVEPPQHDPSTSTHLQSCSTPMKSLHDEEETLESPAVNYQYIKCDISEKRNKTHTVEDICIETASIRYVDDICTESLEDDMKDPTVNDDIRDSTVIDDITHSPINDDITDSPVNDDITDSPVNEDIIDLPINDDITDSPVNEDITDSPVNHSITGSDEELVNKSGDLKIEVDIDVSSNYSNVDILKSSEHIRIPAIQLNKKGNNKHLPTIENEKKYQNESKKQTNKRKNKSFRKAHSTHSNKCTNKKQKYCPNDLSATTNTESQNETTENLQSYAKQTTEKENKIPVLNLRKVREKKVGPKITANENMYVIANDNDHEVPGKRKSTRRKKNVNHKDYVYDDNKCTSNVKKSAESKNTKSKNGQFECEDCGKVLSNLTALRVHLRQHSGARPFACSICGKTFSTNGNRMRHEIGHKGEKNFQCSECNKAFTTAKNLEIHQRVHTGEKPYICDICQKRFTQLGSLKAHTDLHKGEKRYLCPYCGKAFTQKTNLDTHVLRHNKNNRQFKCDQCNNSFFSKGELERHSFKHTKERPYLCDFCPKSFTRAQYLKYHKTLHTQEKPFSCQKCNETFSDSGALKKHKQWHKVQDTQKSPTEGEIIIEQEVANDEEVQQTCIVTTSEITGMKQIIMASDKDFPADVIQQFVDSAIQMEAESLEVTHMVPVVADSDGTLTQVDSTDDGSQDIYQITFLDTNSDSEHSNIVTAIDFSAMNLLANATSQQFNEN